MKRQKKGVCVWLTEKKRKSLNKFDPDHNRTNNNNDNRIRLRMKTNTFIFSTKISCMYFVSIKIWHLK